MRRHVARAGRRDGDGSASHAFIAVRPGRIPPDAVARAGCSRSATHWRHRTVQLAVATPIGARNACFARRSADSGLGHGLIFEVAPLGGHGQGIGVAVYARERGFHLGDDVIAYCWRMAGGTWARWSRHSQRSIAARCPKAADHRAAAPRMAATRGRHSQPGLTGDAPKLGKAAISGEVGA